MSKKKPLVENDVFIKALESDLDRIAAFRDEELNFAAKRLRARARKRLPSSNTRSLESDGLEKFLAVNREMACFQPDIHAQCQVVAASFIEDALIRYEYSVQGKEAGVGLPFSWEPIYSNWAFGPGASNGVTGTGTVEKIVQPFTATPDAVPYVEYLRRITPRLRQFDLAMGWDGTVGTWGSRLTTVPKNEEAIRVIAIEPSGNMAFQLAGGRFIEGALRLIGLDLKSQQVKNRRFALVGSKTGYFATLDLSQASDRIHPETIRALWPKEWYAYFMRFRSPMTTLPGDSVPRKLHMLSTMGNGFTFPLMTMTLLALVHANRCVFHDGPSRGVDFRKTGVFGDDIIVPSHEVDTLVRVLASAGFVVNADKSFHEGPFRESCGMDAYEGKDVTPFYVKSLADTRAVYVALNQVIDWSARHDMWLVNTVRLLLNALQPTGPLLVPEWAQPFAGLRTARCPRTYKQWTARQKLRRLTHEELASMLAAGGYVESSGRDGAFYSRRDDVEYRIRYAKIPKSYLDGWDPLLGDRHVSKSRAQLIELALTN